MSSSELSLSDRVKAFNRRFPTGVTLVTVNVDGEPHGLAVNAFSSVSLDPSMAMVCVKTTSQTHVHLCERNEIAISVVANDQQDIAARFARSGGEKFAGVAWKAARNGAPIVRGVSAYLELTIVSRVSAGTHTIFIGEITHAETGPRPPLLYLDSRFFDGARLEAFAP